MKPREANQSEEMPNEAGTGQAPPYKSRLENLIPTDPKGGGKIKVALVPTSGPNLESEVQAILQRRLRIGALLGAGGFSVELFNAILARVLSPVPMPYFRGTSFWFFLVRNLAVMAVMVGLFILVSRKKGPLPIKILRQVEWVLVGVVMAMAGWALYLELEGWLPKLVPITHFGESLVLVLAKGVNSFWLVAIVIYGAFIPNSLRRCVLMVTLMACVPLAISAVVGFQIPDLPLSILLRFLGQITLGMSFAAVFAIYASHSFDLLRREAFVARKLGQYQLQKPLGAGGMGEVFLGEHVLLRRPCAIKLIRAEAAGDPKNLQRFEREVKATAALTSWHTVEIFDYGHTDDGTFYYVMEYLPGLNLEQLVSQFGPLPPERVVHFLRQMCSALHEAHAAGLIHRDIKPSNIIVGERGLIPDVAKLLDFGLVRFHSETGDPGKLTQEGSIPGTPAFMSPEQASGIENLDARTDIYSLMSVAYFLLTGQPPFVRDTVMRTLAAHIAEPVVPPSKHNPNIPSDLDQLIVKNMDKDPDKRCFDVLHLDLALSQCQCNGLWTQDRADQWWRELKTHYPKAT